MIWHQGPPPYLTFARLGQGQRHAVFTRLGGVSQGHLASLNQSLMVADDPTHVHENQRRAQAVLHCVPEQVVNCQQVHGNHVTVVTAADGGGVVPATDGLVTADPDVVLTMRYADCVPVLLYCATRGVVGLAHAGWRGTVQGVAAQTALVMMEAFDCLPHEISAGIGPSIGPCCYEVGPQVVVAFATTFRDEGVIGAPTRHGHARIDLWQANAAQLRAVGVRSIEVSRYCTYCHRDTFFSHRGDCGRTGRFAVYLGLLP